MMRGPRCRSGFPLIECWRGTSDAEATHRRLKVGCRKWTIGVELLHCSLTEFCHRCNHRILFERRIAGFLPRLGHFNTWLTDLAQNLVAHNHGVCCCPHWSNASQSETTPEKHGAVPLYSKKLGNAINRQAELLGKTEDIK
jgi:hypothetical protein